MTTARILSLGAGVQSSTLLLMAIRGGLKIDGIVFADTQWEPKAVYKHLDWLKEYIANSGIPFVIGTAGNIRERALTLTAAGSRKTSLPYYTENGYGQRGQVMRQCTSEFKVRVIMKATRKLLGVKQLRARDRIIQIQGISLDERTRCRMDKPPFYNEYPLIDMRMTRLDCLRWLEGRGYPRPPKSSCIGCPFHSDRQWREMDPDEFEDACQFDEALRANDRRKWKGQLYLHRLCKPLRHVDFALSHEQPDMFENECYGLCGL